MRKGADDAGAVFLKVNRLDGRCEVLSPAQRMGASGEVERGWARPLGDPVPESDANTYFERQIRFDPDIWIVEIEDREGRRFVDEPIG